LREYKGELSYEIARRVRSGSGGRDYYYSACAYRGKAVRTSLGRRRAGCITRVIPVGGGGRVCEGARCGGRGARARRNPWRLIDRSRKHANDKRARAFFVKTKTEKKRPTLESQPRCRCDGEVCVFFLFFRRFIYFILILIFFFFRCCRQYQHNRL